MADLIARVHREDTTPLPRVPPEPPGFARVPEPRRFRTAHRPLPEPHRSRAADGWAPSTGRPPVVPARRTATAGPDGRPGPRRAAPAERPSDGRPLGHWLVGALAAATVLTTSVVVSGLGRPSPDTGSTLAAGDLAALRPSTLPEPPAAGAPVEATDLPARPRAKPPAAPARRTVVDCGSRPGRVLDLANWKLTLPTGSSEEPTEIQGARLRTFTSADWFATRDDCRAVAFRAPVNGVTTSGSKNPRSELREMSQGGRKAGWSSSSGTHTMVVREAFTTLPQGKPHLVGAQIHDAEDDVTVFRLEGTKLYVTNGDDTHHALADPNYRLGTPFEAKYVVSGGQVKAFYNGALVTTITKSFDGAYFKAGAYTQANCENAAPCSSANYGETLIYALEVNHS